VRVDVRGRTDIGMAQEPLSQFEIAGLFVQEASSRMPEGVKPRCSLRSGNARAIERGIKHIPSQYIWIQRTPKLLRKHEIFRTNVNGPLQMIRQMPGHLRTELPGHWTAS